jgi:hypothetical protein
VHFEGVIHLLIKTLNFDAKALMLDKLASVVLSRTVGRYVEGIDFSQLQLSLQVGDVKLSDLQLRENLLLEYGLPFLVLPGSYIGLVQAKIPWTKLQVEAVHVQVSDVSIRLKALEIKDLSPEMWTEVLYQIKLMMVNGAQRIEEEDVEKSGFFHHMLELVLQNIHLEADNITVELTDQEGNYTLGAAVERVSVRSVDENGMPLFARSSSDMLRKRVDITNVMAYFKFGSEDMEHLIRPASVSLVMEQHGGDSSATSVFLRDKLLLELSERQYFNLLRLAEFVANFQITAQYIQYRPRMSVKESPREWWKYVLHIVHDQIENVGVHLKWDRLQKRRADRLRYIALHKRLSHDSKEWLEALTSEETEELKGLERQLLPDDILLYRSIARQELRHEEESYHATKEMVKSTSTHRVSSFLRSWLGAGTRLSDEDLAAIQVDDNSRAELYASFGYDEKLDISYFGKRDNSFLLDFAGVRITLRASDVRRHELFALDVGRILFDYSTSRENTKIHALIGSLSFVDVRRSLDIISTVDSGDGDLLDYSMDLEGKSTILSMRRLRTVLHIGSMQRLINFIVPPRTIRLDVAKYMLARSQTGGKSTNLTNMRYHAVIEAPQIVWYDSSVRSPTGHGSQSIMIDLGHIEVDATDLTEREIRARLSDISISPHVFSGGSPGVGFHLATSAAASKLAPLLEPVEIEVSLVQTLDLSKTIRVNASNPISFYVEPAALPLYAHLAADLAGFLQNMQGLQVGYEIATLETIAHVSGYVPVPPDDETETTASRVRELAGDYRIVLHKGNRLFMHRLADYGVDDTPKHVVLVSSAVILENAAASLLVNDILEMRFPDKRILQQWYAAILDTLDVMSVQPKSVAPAEEVALVDKKISTTMEVKLANVTGRIFLPNGSDPSRDAFLVLSLALNASRKATWYDDEVTGKLSQLQMYIEHTASADKPARSHILQPLDVSLEGRGLFSESRKILRDYEIGGAMGVMDVRLTARDVYRIYNGSMAYVEALKQVPLPASKTNVIPAPDSASGATDESNETVGVRMCLSNRDRISMHIVDDSRGFEVPFMRLDLFSMRVEIGVETAFFDTAFSTEAEIFYFSRVVSAWEPLIERIPIVGHMMRKAWRAYKEDPNPGLQTQVELTLSNSLMVNITESFINEIIGLATLFQAGPDKVFSIQPRAQYRLINHVGVPMNIRHGATQASVEHGASYAFDIYRDRPTPTVDLAIAALGVNVPNISILKDTTFRYEIPRPPQMPVMLIVDIVLMPDGTKEVRVRSDVRIENGTSIDLQVFSHVARGSPREMLFRVPAHESLYVPLSTRLSCYGVSFAPLVHVNADLGAEPISFDSLRTTSYTLKTFHYKAASAEEGETSYILASTKNNTLSIMPAVYVTNMLPAPAVYELSYDARFSHVWWSAQLSPAQQVDILHLNPKMHLYLRVATATLTSGAPVHVHFPINQPKMEKLESTIDLVDKAGLSHIQHVDLSFRDLVRRISVRADYWIVNKLPQPLSLMVKNRIYDFEPDQVRLFSSTSSGADYARVVDGGDRSKAFSLRAFGSKGEISCKNRRFGISVATAPGKFSKSSVVTILPRYVVKNFLPFSIELRSGSVPNAGADKAAVPTEALRVLHGQSLELVTGGQDVRLRLADDPTAEWTFSFGLDDVQSFVIQLSRNIWCNVAVEFVDSQMLLSLRESPDGPPFRLENHTLETIRLWQIDVPEEQKRKSLGGVVTLQAKENVSFGWDYPPGTRAVVVEVFGQQYRLLLEEVDRESFLLGKRDTTDAAKSSSQSKSASEDATQQVVPASGDVGSAARDQQEEALHEGGETADNAAREEAEAEAADYKSAKSEFSYASSLLEPKQSNEVWAQVTFDKSTRVLRLLPEPSRLPTTRPLDTWSLSLSLEQAQISVLNYEPRELIVMSLFGFTAMIEDTGTERAYDIMLKRMQIDNQVADARYPVLFFSKDNTTAEVDRQNDQSHFLHTVVSQSTLYTGVNVLNYVGFLMMRCKVAVDESLLRECVEMGMRLSEHLAKHRHMLEQEVDDKGKGHKARSDILDENERVLQTVLQANQALFERNEEEAGSTLWLIKRLHLQPLHVDVTFHGSDLRDDVQPYISTLTNLPIARFVASVGLLFTNITDAPIRLRALYAENVFGPPQTLLTVLEEHYRQYLVYQVLRLAGSLDFIGNPLPLVNNLGTAVYDFFAEPAKGASLMSPQAFAVGMSRGSQNLLAKTVESSFDAATKITSSLGKLFAVTTFDDDYVRASDMDEKKRVSHVGEGMSQGSQSLVKSVASAVTGLVKKPAEGAAEDGATGFMKGVMSGAAGAASKPLSGVMQFASKATEGARASTGKNVGVSGGSAGGPMSGKKRLRPPRKLERGQPIRGLTSYNAASNSSAASLPSQAPTRSA